MKLLIDQHLSRHLIPLIRDHFPGSTHVLLLGLDRRPDFEIWERAARDGYVILTCDHGFRTLSAVYGAPPKVIHVVARRHEPAVLAARLVSLAADLADFAKGDSRVYQLGDADE
ncbi:MAG: DUF5615 family PIN-like protein [Dehalococcoidia bacterium]